MSLRALRIRCASAAVIVAASSSANLSAQAPWLVLQAPARGMTLRVDTASISTIGALTFGSLRWTGFYAGDSTDAGVKYAYVERSLIAQCGSGTISMESLAYYAPEDTVISGIFWEETDWQFRPLQDGSAASFERDLICAFASRRRKAGAPDVHVTGRMFVVRPTVIAPESREVDMIPRFAGFRLGQPIRIARPLVGQPLTVDSLGQASDAILSLANAKTGITVLASWGDGVGAILSTKREAGDLGGVRVGDTRADAIARWGAPATASAGAALWLTGRFVISASFDDSGRITRLGVSQ